MKVTNDRPWRLADLSFVPSGNGRERATINGVEVVREDGRYWIITPNGPLWSNIVVVAILLVLAALYRITQPHNVCRSQRLGRHNNSSKWLAAGFLGCRARDGVKYHRPDGH